jgi:hypothetical protein
MIAIIILSIMIVTTPSMWLNELNEIIIERTKRQIMLLSPDTLIEISK